MRYGLLARWAVGITLTAALGTIDCGGDDTTPGTGTGGTGGTSTTTASGGKGGTAGTAGTTGTAGNGGSGGTGGSGTAGNGGSAGTGGKGGTGGTGGTTGAGGSAGSGGKGGTGGAAPDSGTDAPSDAPKGDASDATTSETGPSDGGTDATDARSADAPDGAVTFAAVVTIFNNHCVKCHKSNDGATTGLIDLQTSTGLYTRLTSPLSDGQEGQCGFGDGGTDGGDAGPLSNRSAVVPGDTMNSLLFLKIVGTQPMGTPPAGCGARMPRISVVGSDGGPMGSVGCDQADGGAEGNCLNQADLDTIGTWITQGAHEN